MSLIGRNGQAQYYQLGGEPLDIIKPMSMEYGLMAQPKNDPLTFKSKKLEVGTTGNTIQYNNTLASINQQKNQAVRLLQQRYSQYGKSALDPNDPNFEETSNIIKTIQALTDEENKILNVKGQFDNNYKTITKDQDKVNTTPGLGEKAGQTARGIYINGEDGVFAVPLKQLFNEYEYNLSQNKDVPVVTSNQLLNNSQVISYEDSLPLINKNGVVKVESIYNFDDKAITEGLLSKFEGKTSLIDKKIGGSSDGGTNSKWAIKTSNANNINQLYKFITSLDSGTFNADTENWFENQYLNYMKKNGGIQLVNKKLDKDGKSINLSFEKEFVTNIADKRAYESFKAIKLAEIYGIKIDTQSGEEITSMTSAANGVDNNGKVTYDEIQNIMYNPESGNRIVWNTVENRYTPDVFINGLKSISRYLSQPTNDMIKNYSTSYNEYQKAITNGETDKADRLLVDLNDNYIKVVKRLEKEAESANINNTTKWYIYDYLAKISNTVNNFGATIAKGTDSVPVGQSQMYAKITPLNEGVDFYTHVVATKGYTALGEEINNTTLLFSTHVISDVIKFDASVQITDEKGRPNMVKFSDAKLTERSFYNHLQFSDKKWRQENNVSYVVSWTAISEEQFLKQKFKVSDPKNPNKIKTVSGSDLKKDKELRERVFTENNIYDDLDSYWSAYGSKHTDIFNNKDDFKKTFDGQYFIPVYHDYIPRGDDQKKTKNVYRKYNRN